jgi:hypothetical protein
VVNTKDIDVLMFLPVGFTSLAMLFSMRLFSRLPNFIPMPVLNFVLKFPFFLPILVLCLGVLMYELMLMLILLITWLLSLSCRKQMILCLQTVLAGILGTALVNLPRDPQRNPPRIGRSRQGRAVVLSPATWRRRVRPPSRPLLSPGPRQLWQIRLQHLCQRLDLLWLNQPLPVRRLLQRDLL